MREVLGTGDTPPPAPQRVYEEPAERRQRLLAERQPVVEVKATTPVEEPDDEMTGPVWPADLKRLDDEDDGLG